jgi:hypothetical protein
VTPLARFDELIAYALFVRAEVQFERWPNGSEQRDPGAAAGLTGNGFGSGDAGLRGLQELLSTPACDPGSARGKCLV